MDVLQARPLSEWTEDEGAVLWWVFPIVEPPYVGSPLDVGLTVQIEIAVKTDADPDPLPTIIRKQVGGWPDYHTHWTRIEMPAPPARIEQS